MVRASWSTHTCTALCLAAITAYRVANATRVWMVMSLLINQTACPCVVYPIVRFARVVLLALLASLGL